MRSDVLDTDMTTPSAAGILSRQKIRFLPFLRMDSTVSSPAKIKCNNIVTFLCSNSAATGLVYILLRRQVHSAHMKSALQSHVPDIAI